MTYIVKSVTKLVLRIVINRIRGRTLDEIAPVQYGFMPDKGTGNCHICVTEARGKIS